jgi:hypothetical protein
VAFNLSPQLERCFSPISRIMRFVFFPSKFGIFGLLLIFRLKLIVYDY